MVTADLVHAHGLKQKHIRHGGWTFEQLRGQLFEVLACCQLERHSLCPFVMDQDPCHDTVKVQILTGIKGFQHIRDPKKDTAAVALTAATLALALNNIFEKKNHAKPNGNR